jgi:general secretion pathway protein J
MKAPRGFTLLELLIAVAVFAAVSAMAYGGLRVVLEGDARTRERVALLGELQVAFAVLERDLRHAVEARPRDRFGDALPALRFSTGATGPVLELVRAGGVEGKRLSRVAWRVGEAGLERLVWEVVDAGDETEPFVRVFVASARSGNDSVELRMLLRFAHLAQGGEQLASGWPPTGPGAPALPALVEVILEVPGLGRVERHIALKGGA